MKIWQAQNLCQECTQSCSLLCRLLTPSLSQSSEIARRVEARKAQGNVIIVHQHEDSPPANLPQAPPVNLTHQLLKLKQQHKLHVDSDGDKTPENVTCDGSQKYAFKIVSVVGHCNHCKVELLSLIKSTKCTICVL